MWYAYVFSIFFPWYADGLNPSNLPAIFGQFSAPRGNGRIDLVWVFIIRSHRCRGRHLAAAFPNGQLFWKQRKKQVNNGWHLMWPYVTFIFVRLLWPLHGFIIDEWSLWRWPWRLFDVELQLSCTILPILFICFVHGLRQTLDLLL